MRFLVLILLALSVNGCATIHEKCSDPDIVSRYRDYDQCYAEESAARERKRAAIRQAFTYNPPQIQRQPSCTTTYNAYFHQFNTTCN
jgi:hypothetical protein